MEKLCLFFQCPGEYAPEPQFCHFPRVPVSLLSEARGLAKLSAVLGLLIPVINAAVSVSLSNALWSLDTV